MYEYILALDPSGAFEEGKGTTGWCLFKTISGTIVEIGAVTALKYATQTEYWGVHITLLERVLAKYKNVKVVCEDYLLYAHKADDQINSHMETCQLIGLLKYHVQEHFLSPMKMQRACEVKNRWKNVILLHKGIIIKQHGYFCTPIGSRLTNHELDAIRHAVHYATFYNV